jgi:hypothetical protein
MKPAGIDPHPTKAKVIGSLVMIAFSSLEYINYHGAQLVSNLTPPKPI